jgi:CubicO group peptidase (beta-lactamase class C family)
MNDTTFHPTADQKKRTATLYKAGDDGKSLVRGTHWLVDVNERTVPNPSGGLYSTASDLARFYQMILNEGVWEGKRIVSAEAVRQMTSVQTGDIKAGFAHGSAWGLGWGIVREPQDATSMLSPGSFGHGGAFGTQGWIDPKRQMIFVLLVQRLGLKNGDASELRRTFQDAAVHAIGDP